MVDRPPLHKQGYTRGGVAADAGPGRRAHRRDILRLVSGADLDLLALVYMLGQLQRIQPEALDAPDFVGIGAKPARQDGRRGPRSSRSGPPVLLPLRALDAVLCAHRPARGVNWIGRSSSPGPPTIRTLGADGRSPLPLRPRSNVIAALKAMAEV